MKNMLRRLREDERGLTLVELLAVIVILAIVGAIAFVAIGNVIENSKKDAHVANALQVISAAKLYEASINEEFTSATLKTATEGENEDEEEVKLDTIGELIDPWTKKEYKNLENAKVEKSDDGVYSIKSFNASEGCNITATEKNLRKDGR